MTRFQVRKELSPQNYSTGTQADEVDLRAPDLGQLADQTMAAHVLEEAVLVLVGGREARPVEVDPGLGRHLSLSASAEVGPGPLLPALQRDDVVGVDRITPGTPPPRAR